MIKNKNQEEVFIHTNKKVTSKVDHTTRVLYNFIDIFYFTRLVRKYILQQHIPLKSKTNQ